MYKFLTKNGQTIAFGLGVLVTAIFLIAAIPNIELVDTEGPDTNIFNAGIVGAIILGLIAAAAMVLFGLFQVATTFKSSIKGIIGFGVLIIIFIVAYTTANADLSSEVTAIQASAAEQKVTGSNLQFIGGSIITALILMGIAFAAFVISEIINFFK